MGKSSISGPFSMANCETAGGFPEIVELYGFSTDEIYECLT
jgi:hypothetical protein